MSKLPNHPRRLQEQKEWMQLFKQPKAWEEIVISSDDEEELTRRITKSSASGPSTSKTGGRIKLDTLDLFFFLEEGKEMGLEHKLGLNLREQKDILT